MTAELETRIRHYGEALDRAAQQAAGDRDWGASYVAPTSPPSVGRSRRLLAAAAVVGLLAGVVAVADALSPDPGLEVGAGGGDGSAAHDTPVSDDTEGSGAAPHDLESHSDMDACMAGGTGGPTDPPRTEREVESSEGGDAAPPQEAAALPEPDPPYSGSDTDTIRDAAEDERKAAAHREAAAHDRRWQACLAVLEGVVLAEGTAGDGVWELLASDEPTGRWVQLRPKPLEQHQAGMPPPQPPFDGIFRMALTPGDELESLFSQLGTCCRFGNASLVVAVARADVERVALLRDGAVLDEAHTVKWTQYAPPLPVDPETPEIAFAVLAAPAYGMVDVLFHLADGSSIEPVTGGIDLSHRGG